MSASKLAPMAPRKAIEDVRSEPYTRPPTLQRTPNLLQVVWHDPATDTETIIAETDKGYRVCETTHCPTYYLPPDSLQTQNGVEISQTNKSSFCEWKGPAAYHQLKVNGVAVRDRIWSYPRPTGRFSEIKGYYSFYASSSPSGGAPKASQAGWRCYVDKELVAAQEGDFYGGWITDNIKGRIKGGPGTWGW